jgi:two-component system cell cycle response regulator PopA
LGQDVRLLVVARDEAVAGPLCAGLDALGWRTVTARGAATAQIALEDLPIEAGLVVIEGVEDADHMVAKLRAKRSPRPLPLIGVRTGGTSSEIAGFDLVLAAACHPSQVALRLDQLVRAAAAEEEFALRRRTFEAHGGAPAEPQFDRSPLRVLTVGEPAPKFLALSHALKARRADVTAAFTAYTAFDYLHERAFDAVALWGGETPAEALSIAAGMRRNSRLYHLPSLLYLRSRAEIDAEAAYRRGLTDIATAETPEDETAARIVGLASAYRREVAIRRALEQARGPGLTDPGTGLFTAELFRGHLDLLAARAAATRRGLSAAVLRIAERPRVAEARAGGWLDRATMQIGSMIARLVRAEDCAGRLGPDVYALALPGAGEAAARGAAERIAAVIACTAFQGRPGERPFTVDFEIGAAQLRQGDDKGGRAAEDAQAMLTRALRDLSVPAA